MIDIDDNDEEDYSLTQSRAIIQIEKYRHLKNKILYDQNSLNWWKENETKYSSVSLHSIVSVPCER